MLRDLPARGWRLRRGETRFQGGLPSRAIRLPWAVRTIRIPKLEQFRPCQGTDVASDEAPLVHRKPAGKFSGGGPLPGATDIENQGSKNKLPRPLAERLDPWNEDSGQTLETLRPLVCRGARCRGTAAVPLEGSWRLCLSGGSSGALRDRPGLFRRRRLRGRPMRGDENWLACRRPPGGVRLSFLRRVEQADSRWVVSTQGAGQIADAGEGRSDSCSALRKPAAESQHRSAQFPDFRRRAADLSVGPAQGPGASDDAPADPASRVSDSNRDPRRFFAFGCDPVNPLASCGPVLPDVSVGGANAGADPTDPEPHTAEPRARFPDPGADGLESRRRLIDGVWVRRFALGVRGAQVENRQGEVPVLGSGRADSRRNRVDDFNLSCCYSVTYMRTGLGVDQNWVRSRGRAAGTGCDPEAGRRELGAIPMAGTGCDIGAGWQELGAISGPGGGNWVRYRGRLAETGCDIGAGWRELGAIPGPAGRNWVRYRGRAAGTGCDTRPPAAGCAG